MQISRHWRMNPQRYRLQGQKDANNQVSLDGVHWYENETVAIATAVIGEMAQASVSQPEGNAHQGKEKAA